MQPEKQRETLGVTIHLVPALILPAPSRVTVRKAPGALVPSRGCGGGSAATKTWITAFPQSVPVCATAGALWHFPGCVLGNENSHIVWPHFLQSFCLLYFTVRGLTANYMLHQ